MMSIVPSTITTAESLSQAGDIGRCELVRGELIMMSPAGANHGEIANEIAFHLTAHVKQRKLGRVFAAETGFLLAENPDTVRAPDVAFVRAERAEIRPQRGYFPGPPDLAVEVLSPEDTASEILDKVRCWLDAGTKSVWIVDPKKRTVIVHEGDKPARTFDEVESIIDERLLDGFKARVADLFPR